MQDELISFQGAAQAGLHGEALKCFVSEFGGIELVVMAPLLFSPVHGGISIAQQGLRIPPISGIEADTNTGSDKYFLPLNLERLLEKAEGAFCYPACTLRTLQLFDKDDKLSAFWGMKKISSPLYLGDYILYIMVCHPYLNDGLLLRYCYLWCIQDYCDEL